MVIEYVALICRFKAMLKSEKFGRRSGVDMRGRQVNLGAKNTLADLYELTSDGGSSGEESDNQQQITIDLARGNGNITSSDEDSDSEWELEPVSIFPDNVV